MTKSNKTQSDNTNKIEALNAAIGQIEKAFGKGSVRTLGEDYKKDIEVVPSGSLALDVALGAGGFPKGRIIEIFGPESSGKTTLALHTIAKTQNNGGTCVFIDAEGTFNSLHAENIGVNMSNLILADSLYSGEDILESVDTLIRSEAVDVIVVDSVAALVPKAEAEGDMGENHIGLHAKLMSQALRKITRSLSHSKCVLIFINQLRKKIGVLYGNPETTPGGEALKFYASVRIDIRRIGGIKEGEVDIGNQIKIKVVKNKVSPPFRIAFTDILFRGGICETSEIVTLGTDLNIIEKAGAWYSYNNTKIGQGKDKAKLYLEENEKVKAEIKDKILSSIFVKDKNNARDKNNAKDKKE
ncbi:recombinase RecA [Candidatus Sneabacter namystus]|uniref:Protein RecA n=1 Tax=Candidatus Sneabacter namystus TaxID=2601646 RepID=A0A5C0UJ58_9RICK|nr:recombinase RecA [Candidatus Sneabacter namystus]QEK39790.1 recombinase RecA [Candidatus Sneabacter namystus]